MVYVAQLSLQSKVVSSLPANDKMHLILQLYVKKFVRSKVTFPNKSDHHDIYFPCYPKMFVSV
jgi:hypothetical protein